MLYLAADHRGFELKEALKAFLTGRSVPFEDCGAFSYDKDDDYVDFVSFAARKITENPSEHKGIFLCGSGHGAAIAANKFKGMRAALSWNKEVAKQSRAHDDANVLVLPADWLEEEEAKEIVAAWLEEKFTGEERHMRRLEKISRIE